MFWFLAMNTTPLPTDELFELELRIAKRADELARQCQTDTEHSVDAWGQAERELWRENRERLTGQPVPECA